MGRQRPAIVAARLGQVDFIAAARPVLMGPELTGPGVDGGALLVAMPQRPDFRRHALPVDEGIVRQRLAIGPNAHDLALVLVHVLSSGSLIVLAEGDEQVAVPVEDQPRTEVMTRGQFRLLAEDHLETFQARQVGTQFSSPHGRSRPATAPGLGIAEIDQPILLEIR